MLHSDHHSAKRTDRLFGVSMGSNPVITVITVAISFARSVGAVPRGERDRRAHRSGLIFIKTTLVSRAAHTTIIACGDTGDVRVCYTDTVSTPVTVCA